MEFNEQTARQMIDGSFDTDKKLELIEKLLTRPSYLLLKLQMAPVFMTHTPIDIVLSLSDALHLMSGISNRLPEDPIHEKVGVVAGQALQQLYQELSPDEVLCAISAMLGSMVVTYAEVTGMFEEGEKND